MENKKNQSLQPGQRDSCPLGCSRWGTLRTHGAATGTESSWDRDQELSDDLCPPVDSGWVVSTPWCCRDGLCQDGQHRSRLAQLSRVSWIPFPAQGHSWEQGASLPHIPDSSFTGETPPEQSFAELSFHGIPGGARSPARRTHRVFPWRIPEKPVLQTGIKSTLPVPSAPKDWECRRRGWGWGLLI